MPSMHRPAGLVPFSGALHRHDSTQGHHPRRRFRHPAASGDPGGLEAVAAGVRQADGLLPARHPDAGGHPRHPGDLDAAGHAAFRAVARRWQPLGHPPAVRGAAQPGRSGAGLPDRRGLPRRRAVGAGAGRQPVLRPRLCRRAARRVRPQRRGDGVCLPGAGPRALRRGGVRCRRARGQPGRKTGAAQEPLCGDRAVFLRRARGRVRTRSRAQPARRARDHRPQPPVSGAGRARRAGHGPRPCLARHRHPREPARSRHVHPDHREAAGPEDRLPRGDRLARGLDRRRAVAHAGAAAGASAYSTRCSPARTVSRRPS